MTEYQTYQDILENGKNQVDMDYNERQRLIKNIDLLETKDHIGILKIIMETSKNKPGAFDNNDEGPNGRKIYTVNNYGTYFDLNDLDNTTLWKISYHVSLCLENVKRDEFRKQAEKQYNDDRSNLEDQLRMDAKLKLTTNRLKIDKFKNSNTPLTKENIDSREKNRSKVESNDRDNDEGAGEEIIETGDNLEQNEGDFDVLPGRLNNDLSLLSNYSIEDDNDNDIDLATKIDYDDDE
jgi:hypothetical protein